MDSRCDLSKTKYYEDQGIHIGHTYAGSPKRERNDCAPIALSVVANISYVLSHAICEWWGRKPRSYTPNWIGFIRRGPFKWRRRAGHITLRKFVHKYPKGRYVILFRPRSSTCHVATVVDSTVFNCNIDTPRCIVAKSWEFKGLKKGI